MKKYILLVLLSLLVISCEEVDDNTNLSCTENCTRIEGRIVTEENLPLKNIELQFRFKKSTGTYSSYVRKIAKTKTDANGFYSMDFFIKDEELGEESEGYFDLFINRKSIPKKSFSVNDIYLFSGFYSIEDRNTTFTKNAYLPTKKEISIKLQNFTPIQQGDYFEVQLYLPCGFDNSEISPFYGDYHRYVTESINKYRLNTNLSQTYRIPAALNKVNYVVLVRVKNGIYSEERISLPVNENSNEIFTYDY